MPPKAAAKTRKGSSAINKVVYEAGRPPSTNSSKAVKPGQSFKKQNTNPMISLTGGSSGSRKMDLTLSKSQASEQLESTQIDRDYLKTMNLKLKSTVPQKQQVTDTKTQFDKMIEGMISPKGGSEASQDDQAFRALMRTTQNSG